MTGVFEPTPPVAIESPCILVCMLDTASGLCLGCGRTGDEIARWTQMSPADRRTVMGQLSERLAALPR